MWKWITLSLNCLSSLTRSSTHEDWVTAYRLLNVYERARESCQQSMNCSMINAFFFFFSPFFLIITFSSHCSLDICVWPEDMNRQINVVQLFSSSSSRSDKKVTSDPICTNEFYVACQTSQSKDNRNIVDKIIIFYYEKNANFTSSKWKHGNIGLRDLAPIPAVDPCSKFILNYSQWC